MSHKVRWEDGLTGGLGGVKGRDSLIHRRSRGGQGWCLDRGWQSEVREGERTVSRRYPG